EDAFGERSQKAVGPCPGVSPWHGSGTAEVCSDGRVRTTLRGASNLYFSLVQSALSIPEWDDPVQLAIGRHEGQLERVSGPDDIAAGVKGGFLPHLKGFDPEAVYEALERRRALRERSVTPLDMKSDEFHEI